MSQKQKKQILTVFIVICIIGIIVGIALLIHRINLNRQLTEIPSQPPTTSATDPPTEAPETDPTEPPTDPFEPRADLVEANEKNPDVIGVLTYGAGIELFVPLGEDNDFYLHHDYLGNPDNSGAAFLDTRCSLSPRDTNWIIHGHNMRSGAIFGNLNKFRTLDYLKENPLIYLSLMEKEEVYVPYAILDVNVDPNASNYFKITEWNFDTDEEFRAYTGYYKDNSMYKIPVYVKPDDDLLVLSTCSYGYSDGRLLIACRKLREGETPEKMTELLQKTE